jgi:hypothetical protein
VDLDTCDLGVPALHVDTTFGYTPDLASIVAFCRACHSEYV